MRRLSLLVLFGVFLFGFCQYAVAESPIVISPEQWFSGEMDLGSSRATTFAIRNEGTDPVVINKIGFQSENSADFAVTQSPAMPFTLGSYEEVNVEITFNPSTEGLHSAAIQVEYTPAQP
jgi:hypothetical protein